MSQPSKIDKCSLSTMTIKFLNPRKLGVNSASRLKLELRALEWTAAICRYLDDLFLVLGLVENPFACPKFLEGSLPSTRVVAASWLSIFGLSKSPDIDAVDVVASSASEKCGSFSEVSIANIGGKDMGNFQLRSNFLEIPIVQKENTINQSMEKSDAIVLVSCTTIFRVGGAYACHLQISRLRA